MQANQHALDAMPDGCWASTEDLVEMVLWEELRQVVMELQATEKQKGKEAQQGRAKDKRGGGDPLKLVGIGWERVILTIPAGASSNDFHSMVSARIYVHDTSRGPGAPGRAHRQSLRASRRPLRHPIRFLMTAVWIPSHHLASPRFTTWTVAFFGGGICLLATRLAAIRRRNPPPQAGRPTNRSRAC